MAGDPRFLKLLTELHDMHVRKAKDYGSDKDVFANVRSAAEVGIEPWRGAWLRSKDKVKRIDQFCIKGELANESVKDSLLDLASYCLITLVLMEEGDLRE